MRLPSIPRSSWIVALSTTLGAASWGAMQWIVGSLIDTGGLQADKAAFLGTVELIAMSVTLLAITPMTQRVAPFSLSVIGLGLAVVANIASCLATNYWALGITRAASGIAFGMLFAIAGIEGARSSQPTRAFAAAGVVSLLLGACKEILLGTAKLEFGHVGVFLAIVAFCLVIGLPLLLLIRQQCAFELDLKRRWPAARSGSATIVMTSMAMFAVATGGLFAFIQQIAQQADVDQSRLPIGLAIITILGASGAVVADRVGARELGPTPLSIGLIFQGVTCWLVLHSTSETAYWVFMLLWVMSYWFCYPLIFGLASSLDTRGRLATATAAVMLAAAAGGTAIAGLLVRYFGAASFGNMSLAVCAAAAGLILVLEARTPHHNAPQSRT